MDVVNFFELVFILLSYRKCRYAFKKLFFNSSACNRSHFSPAYDLVATALVNPTDDEDLALTLNGKKKKINRNDFVAAFNTIALDVKQQKNIFKKMEKAKESWLQFIDISFLNDEMKSNYKNLLQARFARLAEQ